VPAKGSDLAEGCARPVGPVLHVARPVEDVAGDPDAGEPPAEGAERPAPPPPGRSAPGGAVSTAKTDHIKADPTPWPLRRRRSRGRSPRRLPAWRDACRERGRRTHAPARARERCPRTAACQAFRMLARFRRALPTPPARRPSEARPEAHSARVMWGSRQRPEGLAGTTSAHSAKAKPKRPRSATRGMNSPGSDTAAVSDSDPRPRGAGCATRDRKEVRGGACWHARR